MFYAFIFLIELLALFFLSRSLTRRISLWLYSLTKSKKITIALLSFLFLPGTFIHEASHLLMALILMVPIGEMELIPKIDGDEVKMGSVQIGKTDPIRRFLIGIAPFTIGTSLIIWLFSIAVSNNMLSNPLYLLILIYAVFEIGNTMFSSKKDMEGVFPLVLVMLFVFIVLYFAGIKISSFTIQAFLNKPEILEVFKQASIFLAAPLILDLAILLLFKNFLPKNQ